jgi:LPXTG-motif cell wall-anchored protein
MSLTTLRRFAGGALLGLVLAAGTVLSAPAAAAADLPTPTFTPATGGPTAYFKIAGTGCTDTRPGKPQPSVYISSTTTREIGDGGQAQPDGSWTLTTNFGPGAPLGVHTIVAHCDRYDLGEQDYPTIKVLVSATGVTLAPATPTQAPCTTCTTIAAGDTVAIGEVVSMKLTGYKPFEVVTVTMRSTPRVLGTFKADAAGVVTLRFTVPANGAVGSAHTLTFSGNMGTADLVLPFKLGASKTLPNTGADVTVPLVVGTSSLLVGGGLLLLARRRKPETAQV